MKKIFLKTTPDHQNALKDIWNAFMVEKAEFSEHDIPLCPTTASEIPKALISYEEAKKIHKNMLHSKNNDYHINAFIHSFDHDTKIDGKNEGCWSNPQKMLQIAKHFDGCISVDFSTYADFPDPLKRYNFYRMNAIGAWLAAEGIPVISNVRWGTEDTWEYCFDGNPHNSMLCLGTVASNLKFKANYELFAEGLLKMVEVLSPRVLIVYGSSNYPCFDEIIKLGVKVVTFKSKTCECFERRSSNE